MRERSEDQLFQVLADAIEDCVTRAGIEANVILWQMTDAGSRAVVSRAFTRGKADKRTDINIEVAFDTVDVLYGSAVSSPRNA